ncbi:MAG: PEP-CTERM sorting domain-containing protein [Planctomycetes bacterium]|nr:PEP-CTERM sorting domain-containing protein [Planctomycetota bacterium]
MRNQTTSWSCLSTFLVVALALVPSAQAYEMIAVHYDTGEVYEVSMTDASVSQIGSTGLVEFASLEFASDGTLYGFTTPQDDPSILYEIDPVTFVPTAIGPLDEGLIIEGSLVFAPDGTVYATNGDFPSQAKLLTLDLATGAATVVGTIDLGNGSTNDINGMAWRSDGMLVGLDRKNNGLIVINPADASASLLATITPDIGGIGTVGGMAVQGDFGYLVTASPDDSIAGSNELYRFDLTTGDHELIGNFGGTITGSGLGGLAIIPEPASLALLAFGGIVLLRRRR